MGELNWNMIRATCRKRLRHRVNAADLDDCVQDAVGFVLLHVKQRGHEDIGIAIVRSVSRVVKSRKESSPFVWAVSRLQGEQSRPDERWQDPSRLASRPYVAKYGVHVLQDTWNAETESYAA